MIENGYCIIIENFYAVVVPFITLGVTYAYNTVPEYTVQLPNGKNEEFNETELKYSKEELIEQCNKLNEEMKERRELWYTKGLPELNKAKLEEMTSGLNFQYGGI